VIWLVEGQKGIASKGAMSEREGAPRWYPFDCGLTVGQRGSEEGTIVIDEENVDGARITLERNGHTPFSITCGIYGWMVHTHFFSDEVSARNTLEEMKESLDGIVQMIPCVDDPELESNARTVQDAISRFVDHFQ
jgi:hypothetical protein